MKNANHLQTAPIIAPSFLSCDFGRINEEVAMLNATEAGYIHMDIMDGVFVPNISFGLPILQAVHRIATLPLDVHLMIVHPEPYFEAFVEAGAAVLTFHYEATNHVHRAIHAIKRLGIEAGVAINPHTPVNAVFDLLEDLDVVLVMSVNPGFGGQKFIYRTLHKIQELKDEIRARNAHCRIEVDGGIGLQNAESIVRAGADVLVAGSAVFSAQDPTEYISKLSGVMSDII